MHVATTILHWILQRKLPAVCLIPKLDPSCFLLMFLTVSLTLRLSLITVYDCFLMKLVTPCISLLWTWPSWLKHKISDDNKKVFVVTDGLLSIHFTHLSCTLLVFFCFSCTLLVCFCFIHINTDVKHVWYIMRVIYLSWSLKIIFQWNNNMLNFINSYPLIFFC